MKNFIIRLGVKITILTILTFNSGCVNKILLDSGDEGFLQGVISIGPICPVETDPPRPECLPTAETYKAYPVSIWTTDKSRKIVQLNPSLDGSFRAELAAGKYMVMLDKANISIGSSNLPVEVEINSREETLLNITIDTGIR